jgi:hypothetical protein
MLKEGEQANAIPSQLPMLTHIADALPIMPAPNPITRQALQSKKHTHSQWTCNNIPGSIPLITNTAIRLHVPLPLLDPLIATAPRRSTNIHTSPMQQPPHGGLRSDYSLSMGGYTIITSLVRRL